MCVLMGGSCLFLCAFWGRHTKRFDGVALGVSVLCFFRVEMFGWLDGWMGGCIIMRMKSYWYVLTFVLICYDIILLFENIYIYW